MRKQRFEELTKLIKSEGRKEHFLAIIDNLESKNNGIDNIKISYSKDSTYIFTIERYYNCEDKIFKDIKQTKEYVIWSENTGVIEWCSGLYDSNYEEVSK